MKRILFAALIMTTAIPAVASAQEAEPKFTLPHITVTGAALDAVRPDLAFLTLGVVSEKDTAAAAAADDAALATAAIAELKALGIEPKDIRTTNVTLAPVMLEERDPKTDALVKRTLTGYRASNALEIRIHDVDRAGAIASRVVAEGANTYNGLRFEVSDRTERVDAMRAKAVGDAMRRAALYAHGASMKLGRLLAIEPDFDREGGNAADLPTHKGPSDSGPRVVVIPVEPGLQEIGATASATWELVPE